MLTVSSEKGHKTDDGSSARKRMKVLWVVPNKLGAGKNRDIFVMRELVSMIEAAEREDIEVYVFHRNYRGDEGVMATSKPILEYDARFGGERLFTVKPIEKNI